MRAISFGKKKPAAAEPAASSASAASSAAPSRASALLSKRPHLGSSQLKYQYEVQVHSITFTGPVVPQGAVKVLWTRGSKQAETADGFVGGGRSVEFGSQRLSLLCTLFRDAKREGPTPFADKLCSFFLLGSTSRGAKPLGKCEVNISPFADVLAAAPTSLELTLRKGSREVATLRLSIASRWLKEYVVDSDAESISSAGSLGLGLDDDLNASHRDDDLNPDDWLGDAIGDGSGLGDDGGVSGELSAVAEGAPATAAADEPPPPPPPPPAEPAVDPISASVAAVLQAARESETQAESDAAVEVRRRSLSDDPLDQLAAAVAAAGNNLGDRACGSGALPSAAAAAPAGAPFTAKSKRRATFAGAPPRADELSGDGPPRASVSGRLAATTAQSFSGAWGSSGGDAAEIARLQAGRLELEAQIAASQALQRKVHRRVEEEQAAFEEERAAHRAQVAGLREEIIAAGGREREQSSVAQKLRRQLDEARGEVAVLKRLREEAEEGVAGKAADADAGDSLAWAEGGGPSPGRAQLLEDLQGKLDRSEAHRQEVARKLGKARKAEQHRLAQYEAEIAHLNEKVRARARPPAPPGAARRSRAAPRRALRLRLLRLRR